MLNLNVHPDLPSLVALLSTSHTNVGAAGEKIAAIALQKAGYTVQAMRPGDKAGDLRVITGDGEILRVEVKTARQTAGYGWKFMLQKGTKTDHHHADILLLLCVEASGNVIPFVCPVAALANVKQCTVCKNIRQYSGKLAKYRQRLETLSLEFAALG